MAPIPADTATVVVLPCTDGLCDVPDGTLIELQRQAGAARRKVDAVNAAIAGEIARRSDRALGHQGFSARLGAPTVEAAIQSLTGVSLTDAKALTTVGAALEADLPWLAPVLDGVVDGTLSVATAAAITKGLGVPTENVAADDLLDAAAELVSMATDSTPESAAKSARIVRERLDVASIADLESHRRARRSLTWSEQPDGMTRMVATLDPESAAIITGALDTAMSPRRGAPRFVDESEVRRATDLVDDPRSNAQLAVDTLVDIVNLATRAANSCLDPNIIFGERSPAVRVHVRAEALSGVVEENGGLASGVEENGGLATGVEAGGAFIEGQSAFVSVTTARRYICTAGMLPVIFDRDVSIDVASTRRLHSTRQRIAIAAQWNGCAWTGCDRPPAMTEVHHMDAFNGENTTLANAVPLCRFHHMELHANHWKIRRDHTGTYWLSPPKPPGGVVAPDRQLHFKNPLVT